MERLTVLSIGEKFTFKGFEWKVLDKDEDGVLAIMTRFYKILPFNTVRDNNWTKCSLRRFLNNDFADIVGKRNLILVESDLIADNGDKFYGETTDYVTIISCDQYRKYREVMPVYDGTCSWTLTPCSCNAAGTYGARIVDPTGEFYDDIVDDVYGVAPICKFSSKNLKLCQQAHLVEDYSDVKRCFP